MIIKGSTVNSITLGAIQTKIIDTDKQTAKIFKELFVRSQDAANSQCYLLMKGIVKQTRVFSIFFNDGIHRQAGNIRPVRRIR